MAEIVSHEPATGEELARLPIGDVDAEVAAARGGWAAWASKPLAFRVETLRRFANIVRQRHDAFADLLADRSEGPSQYYSNPVQEVFQEAGNQKIWNSRNWYFR